MKSSFTISVSFKAALSICAFLFLFVGINIKANAALGFTAGTGGTNISADKAANAASPAYTTLTDIVFTEGAKGDFNTNTTLVLNAPSGWVFNTTGFSVTAAGGGNVAIGTVTPTTTSITINLTVGGTNKFDVITISSLGVQATAGGTLPSSGNITATLTPAVTGFTNGTTVAVLSQKAGAVKNFVFSSIANGQTAGSAFNITTITAQDQFNNTLTTANGNSFTGTATLSTSAGSGTVSPTTTSAFTNGVLSGQSVTVSQAVTQSITATSGAATGSSNSFTVGAAAATKLQVLLPGETAAPGSASGKTGTPSAQTAGSSFNVTVNAVDANWNVVSATNNITITSSDANAVLPSSAALVAGTQTFSITCLTAGSRTVTATTTGLASNTSTSASFTVNTGAFTKLQVLVPGETAAPGTVTGKTGTASAESAVTAFNVIVNAVDANWNVVTTGTGSTHTASITSTDPNIVPPANAALVAGTKTFSVTLPTAGTWTVTGTDVSAGAGSPNTSPSITVNAGAASKLQVILPGETAVAGSATGKTGSPSAQTASSSFTITVNAVDASWNIVSATNTVSITSSDANAILPSSAALVAGTQTFNVTCKTAGAQTVTASAGGLTSNTSSSFTVNAGALAKLQLLIPGETAAPGTATGKTGSPSAETAGTAFNVIINAVDANWNVVSSVTDNVTLTTTDVNATLPGTTALVSGTKTLSVTFKTAGTATITATDATNGGITANTSPSVTINVGTLAKLQILVPGETTAPGTATGKTGSPSAQTAGTSFNLIVNAVDANWNLVTSTTHNVTLSSTDANASLAGSPALVAGTRTLTVTLKTAGTQTITASDVTNGTITANTSPSITVNTGALTKLQILLPGETAAPGSPSGKTGSVSAQTAGTAFNVTVNAVDANWNVVIATTDNVTLTSTDANAVLPGSTTLSSGTAMMSITLKTAGSYTVTATDATNGGITANTSASVTVNAGTLTKLQILLPGETAAPGTATGKTGSPTAQTAGIAFNVIVNAVDANWNVVTGTTHNVTLTSTDANATLPATNALVAGTKTLSVTLKTAGTATVTATDATNGTITANTSPSVTVNAGALAKLQLLVPGETAAPGTATGKTGTSSARTAGTAFNVIVNAVDANWNVVTTTTHNVTLTSTDVNASLPATTALVSGTATLSVTFKTSGTATITATDATNGTITANTSPSITINPGAFVKLQILLPGETAAHGTATGKTGTPTAVNSGVSITATVNGVDANWNVVTTATDIIHLTSPDIYPATLAANAALVSGTKTFSVTLFTGATETVTASDATNALITSNTSAAITINPVTRVTTGTGGNWNATTSWVGGIVPAATDDAIVASGASVTVTANATVNSVTFDSTLTTNSTLTVNSTKVLNVNGAISLKSNKGANTSALLTGAGTINCDSINVGGNMSTASGGATTILTTTVSTLNVSGDINIESYDFNPSKHNEAEFLMPSGVVTVSGSIDMATVGANHGPGIDPLFSMGTGAQTGTLILKGAMPFNAPSNAVITLNGTGTTVNYAGTTSQDVYPTVYTTLDLSGSGNKNISTGTGVTSAINILGSAKANIDNGLTLTVTSLSLGGSGAPLGTTGGQKPPASNLNTTYFTTTQSGDINVSTTPRANPAFSGITSSQTICFNTSFSISGTVSSGATYPATTETIYATVNGVTQSGTFGSLGTFTINFPGDPSITAGSSYIIDYIYGGNAALNATENTTTSLTVDFPSVGGTATAAASNICQSGTTTISLTGNTGTIQWQQSATGLGGWSDISGATATPYTTAALTSTTFYRSVVTSGTCGADTSTVASVTITTPYTVTPGGPDATCQSASPGAITLSGASVGNGATTGAWSITTGGGTLSNLSQTATPNTVTYTPVANATGTITLTLLTNAPNVCPANSATRTIVINPTGQWLGTSSINWNDAANWCSGVPTSGTDVIIPSGTTFQPTVNSTATAHNITVNTGATLTITTGGDLSLYGNLSVSGNYTHTAGLLELTGSANQSIDAISAFNVNVNTANVVTLNGNLTVTGTLTLTNGVVATGANSVIVSNTAFNSVVAGTGNTNYGGSWVNGTITRNFSSGSTNNYDFPVGTATNGRVATIASHSLTGITSFTAYVRALANGNNAQLMAYETSITGNPYHTAYTSINSTGTWVIEPNVAPTGGSYDVTLYFNGFSAMQDNQFAILKRPVNSTTFADFKPFGGSLSANNGAGRTFAGGYALRTGLTSFSEFGIGMSGAILPIQLSSFTAEKCDNNLDALLKWTTASELNNNHFDLQLATATSNNDGGLTFTKIGEVKGNGTSDVQHNYSFTDIELNKAGTRYYRLAQVDDDGEITYSDIKALNFNPTEVQLISLYPNPASGSIHGTISSPGNKTVTVSITNILGQEIFSTVLELEEGNNNLTFDVSTLKQDTYLLNITDGVQLALHQKFNKF